MRFYSRFILVVLSAPLGLAAPPSTTANDLGLSADLVTIYSIGGHLVTTRGHYYRSADGRLREDSELGALIMDMSKSTLTALSFERREAVVFAIPGEGTRSAEVTSRLTMPLGHDMHDGRPVTKSLIRMAAGVRQENWMADAIGVVVRSKLETSTTTTTRELKNISRTEPNDALFEIPPGFSVRREVLPATSSTEGWSGQLPGLVSSPPPRSRP